MERLTIGKKEDAQGSSVFQGTIERAATRAHEKTRLGSELERWISNVLGLCDFPFAWKEYIKGSVYVLNLPQTHRRAFPSNDLPIAFEYSLKSALPYRQPIW